ncbi:four-carbon acid sugar kinase family protein [Notoacmeibacter ruber]|uniref:Four-carbon acid sugar kinase family protein n=1 Tax=Notoacmeibacter ruber TaxID=2670375 RepID=A0A3L7JEH3_9HYPH|nr:four-carbon acid sugar kinase family protein [Notoacmeibacter ruber]RLQ88870.1 hypothetical protein D8780_12200 [Notoacmeibacter ruber]
MRRDRVFIVADDLTGALDSAATFAERGAYVRVACRPGNLPEALASTADVVAVATGTRELSQDEARKVVGGVARDLAGHEGVLFRKIDSRMKGHIAAELDALLPSSARLVVNPAIPELGRYCLEGAVCGAGVDIPIAIAERIGRAATIAPTRTQQDLDRQIRKAPSDAVYVGAAGLAQALANRLWPKAPLVPAYQPALPALLAIGSRDPVTAAQVDALEDVPVVAAPNGVCSQFPSEPLLLVRMTPGQEEVSSENASAAFAATLAAAFDQLQPTTLFACGGESAASLLARLEIGQLDVRGQILPGVPIARCVGMPNLTLITKSGGFGMPDTLVKLVKLLKFG